MTAADIIETSQSISFPCTVDVSRIWSVGDGLHSSVFAHWMMEIQRKDYAPHEFDHPDAETRSNMRNLVMVSFDWNWTISSVLAMPGYRPASMREFLAAAPAMRSQPGVNTLVCAGGSFILGSNKVENFRRVPTIRRITDLESGSPHLMLDMGWYYQFWDRGTFMLYAAKP